MKQQFSSSILKLSLLLTLVSFALLSLIYIASARNQSSQFSVPSESVSRAVSWLYEENQNSDGGFGKDFTTGEPASSIESTLDAVLAISATGYSASVPYFEIEKTGVDYLQDNAVALETFAAIGGGTNGKIILALASAKLDARDFSGHDYVAQLLEQFEPSGSYNNSTAFYQGLSILALVVEGEPVPEEALKWLEALQAEDGSWDDGFGTLKNPDATAMSIMALLSSGRKPADPSIVAALEFLKDSQLETGGWEYGPGFGENANSTALAIQALAKAGEDFYSIDGRWGKNGQSPLTALLLWQNTNGAYQADFGQGRFDNFFATAQSIPASVGKPYPFKTFLQFISAIGKG
jgi:iron complex transport system substrate-binding protein